MRITVAAFEDRMLNGWLLELIAEQSPSFLSFLAEAVVTASPEDYSLIRPGLLDLKRKYDTDARGRARKEHTQGQPLPSPRSMRAQQI